MAVSCDSGNKNVTVVGSDKRCKFFYTAGEDGLVKTWDFRTSLQCQSSFQVNDVSLITASAKL